MPKLAVKNSGINKEGKKEIHKDTIENKLNRYNKINKKTIGLFGMLLFGSLIIDYLSLFPIKTFDSFIPWWIYGILLYFFALLFMFSFYIVLF